MRAEGTTAKAGPPVLALVLGSGLGAIAERTEARECIPYADVPGFEATTVAGHKGFLTSGTWAGRRILLFEGRLHFYEGHTWQTVLAPMHIARKLGAGIFIATNAAGGIRPDLEPGRILIPTGHVDWTRPAWWRQRSQFNPYSPRLIGLLRQAGADVGIQPLTGTYAQVTGPCYETPAEIRALRVVGADAVGMSTAREIEAAVGLGLESAALSCITNRAAGLSGGPLCHEEVLSVAAQRGHGLADLLEAFIRLLGNSSV
jgi:purine-nucleoside phosphorylase